ncbi:hypothetical protein ACVGV2_16800 [Bounagaea algeriensis]
MRPRARRRHTRHLVLVLVAVLAGAVGGSVLAGWLLDGAVRAPGVSGLLGPGVGVALGLGAVLWLRRRGRASFQPSPLLALRGSERRRLLRTIRRGESVPPEQHAVARAGAQHVVRQRWAGWVLVGLAVLYGAAAFALLGEGRWILLAGVVVLGGFELYQLWFVRRAQRALAALPEPDPPAESS